MPLRGYSVPMAEHVANGSLDLVYVDADHDYAPVRADAHVDRAPHALSLIHI